MNIIHFLPTLGKGGAELMAIRVLTYMSDVRHHVVCMSAYGPLLEEVKQAGVGFECLDKPPGTFSVRTLLQLRRVLLRQKPDLLVSWLPSPNLYALLAARSGTGVPVVWNIQASDYSNEPKKAQFAVQLSAWVSPWVDLVVYNSEAGARYHQALGHAPYNSTIVTNAVDTRAFTPSPEARLSLRQELGLAPDARLVGIVARWHPVKNHPLFVAACRKLVTAHPDTFFVMAGTGVDWENTALCEAVGETRAHFFPLGERSDVPRIMAGLDLLVSCSFSEGFSNVLVEGMAAGVPCVVTDVGDSARIVGDTGKVLPSEDEAALIRAMGSLLELPRDAWSALSLRVRARALTFDIHGVIDDLRTHYQRTARV